VEDVASEKDKISTGPSSDPSKNTNFYGSPTKWQATWRTCCGRGDKTWRRDETRRDVVTWRDVSSVPRVFATGNGTQHGAERLKNARSLEMLKRKGFYLSSSICFCLCFLPNHWKSLPSWPRRRRRLDGRPCGHVGRPLWVLKHTLHTLFLTRN
jgi:hypothetical protein